MKIKHFTHINLKPTKKHEISFNPLDLAKDIDIPKESIEFAKEYQLSKKISDEYEQDLMIGLENEIIYGFDYLHNNDKIIIPELNPIMIFFSNAVMSHRKLIEFREELLNNSPTVKNYKKNGIDANRFGNFFRMASNCIINLQTTLESFANRLIPDDHQYLDKKGNMFDPTIFDKLDKALPEIKKRRFKSAFKKQNILIRDLIELRNKIIHLKPAHQKTNTKYKVVYRMLLSFKYTETINAVENFINFYEPNLIEKCNCGKEFYFDVLEKKK